jgi:hypothetical protein
MTIPRPPHRRVRRDAGDSQAGEAHTQVRGRGNETSTPPVTRVHRSNLHELDCLGLEDDDLAPPVDAGERAVRSAARWDSGAASSARPLRRGILPVMLVLGVVVAGLMLAGAFRSHRPHSRPSSAPAKSSGKSSVSRSPLASAQALKHVERERVVRERAKRERVVPRGMRPRDWSARQEGRRSGETPLAKPKGSTIEAVSVAPQAPGAQLEFGFEQ